jgi:hypothetical protein
MKVLIHCGALLVAKEARLDSKFSPVDSKTLMADLTDSELVELRDRAERMRIPQTHIITL